MVQLYINEQLAIIDENIYFPFTKKVIDFENPTLINFEGSKTITLKRCVENDDIFGNIAEITRLTYGFEDDKSSILFNQLKKITYKLLDDGILISEGIIQITNITETNYEIELYDNIINIIESFEQTKLSDLDIYEVDGVTPFSKPVNKDNIIFNPQPALLSDLNTTSNINGEELKQRFKDYLDVYNDLTNQLINKDFTDIPGTNLVLNSEATRTNIFVTYNDVLTKPLTIGQTYVLSYNNLTVSSNLIHFYLRINATGYVDTLDIQPNVPFVVNKAYDTIVIVNENQEFSYSITKVKLEKGLIVTPWSKAPEDTQKQVVRRNLVLDSYINQSYNGYGFEYRTVNLVQGKTYTLSINGNTANRLNGKNLTTYIFKSDWTWGQNITLLSVNNITLSTTFVAPYTGVASIGSYYYDASEPRTGSVHLNWYKLEEGNNFTGYVNAPEDIQTTVNNIASDYKLEPNEKTVINSLFTNINSNYNVISGQANILNVVNSLELPYNRLNLYLNYEKVNQIVPVFGDEEYHFNKNKIFGYEYDNTLKAYSEKHLDLPTELKQIEARTFKSYSHSFALPINKVFQSINKRYGDLIEVDNEVYDLLGDLHIKLNKPNVIQFNNENIINTNGYYNTIIPIFSQRDFDIEKNDILNLEVKNQNITIESDIEYKLYMDTSDEIITRVYNKNSDVETLWTKNVLENSVGSLFLTSSIYYYDSNGEVITRSKPNITEIILMNNKNLIYNSDGSVSIKIKNISKHNINTFIFDNVSFISYIYRLTNKVDKSTPAIKNNYSLTFTRDINQSNIGYTTKTKHKIISKNNENIMSGDIINGSNLYPNINIKDFLINFIKGFNLDIINENSKIKIKNKKFYETDEPLIITDIKMVKDNNYYSELNFNTLLPKSDILDNYNNKYKQEYGNKKVFTGYSVKNNNKDVKIPFSIPFFKSDFNSFAYNNFGQYFNSGYSRVSIGVFPENDVLTFAYLKKNGGLKDRLHIFDDYGKETDDDITFNMVNRQLFYNNIYNDEKKWYMDYSYALDNWYTLSPYLFDNDGNIIKSLEMNKPLYSYSNITDSQYNENVTLYYNHFKNFVETVYDVDSHIIECKMFIEDKLSLNKIYNYYNVNYIISEIIEYNPLVPGMYDVKLLKVVDKQKLLNTTNKQNYIEIINTIPIIHNYDDPTYLKVDGKVYNLNNKTISSIKLVTSESNENPTIGGTDCTVVNATAYANEFTAWNYNLSTNTSYYYRIVVIYSDNTTTLSNVKTISFGSGISIPTWTTYAYQTSNNSISIDLSNVNPNGAEISKVEVYISYYDYPNEYSYLDYKQSLLNKNGYSFSFTGLNYLEAPVYYMIKVEGSTGLIEYYYNELNMIFFVDPSFGGILTSNRTTTSISGILGFELGSTDYVYELSVLIGPSDDIDINNYDDKVTLTPNSGMKEFTFNSLNPSTVYYVRPYIRYDGDTGIKVKYGSVSSMNTVYAPASLTCNATSRTGILTVNINTNYQIDNVNRIARRGICYSQVSSTPSISDTTQYDTIKSNGSKSWSFNAGNEAMKSKYRIRAYLTTTDGYTYYSNTVSISTLDIPVIEMLPQE